MAYRVVPHRSPYRGTCGPSSPLLSPSSPSSPSPPQATSYPQPLPATTDRLLPWASWSSPFELLAVSYRADRHLNRRLDRTMSAGRLASPPTRFRVAAFIKTMTSHNTRNVACSNRAFSPRPRQVTSSCGPRAQFHSNHQEDGSVRLGLHGASRCSSDICTHHAGAKIRGGMILGNVS